MRATETELSLLHKRVAENMVNALDAADRADQLLNKYSEELPHDVVTYLKQCKDVNPTLLNAATKFLKDNNISCDMEDSGALASLHDSLKENKNKRARSISSIPIE